MATLTGIRAHVLGAGREHVSRSADLFEQCLSLFERELRDVGILRVRDLRKECLVFEAE
jgi:hypothetical protein